MCNLLREGRFKIGERTLDAMEKGRFEVDALAEILEQARNRGAAGWPAWTGRGWTESGLVHWQARWRRAEDGAEWSAPHAFPLRRDVGRGETLMQPLIVPTPPEPGAYELQITLVQQDGARFSAARNQAGRIRLDVAPPRR